MITHRHGSLASFSAPFIRRPVATSLLAVAVLLAGIVAFRQLPVAPLPQMDFPTISVSAQLPGASPETMASSVATPLERQFGRIAAVTQMTSQSQLSNTSVTLQFDLNRDINAASRDVEASIAAARGNLPTDLPSQPTYRQINPADSPILFLAMTSTTVPIPTVYDYADTIVAQEIDRVLGVGQVNVFGSAQPAVRIAVNPQQLNAYGITLEQVRGVLATANANRPKGLLQDGQRQWMLNTNDQMLVAAPYGPLVVAWRNGAAVRLSDVAQVADGVADVRVAGTSNGEPAVILAIVRQPGANILDTIGRIRAILPRLRASLPPTIHLNVIIDRSPSIRASIHEVETTLLIAVLLVVLVVFAFLRDPWATAIPSLSVPLALVGSFAFMYLMHFSIDNLSLMALTIATGFVVDDAIVVIENIARHIEGGMRPMAAAYLGAREMGFTVLSMSLSLIAVFIPILLMGGIVGRLFREFAVTLSVAILLSLMISLTVTPMMCARFLRHERGEHNLAYRISERAFNALHNLYARMLGWVLRHQLEVLLLLVATVSVNVYLAFSVPKGFFPQQDVGRLTGNIIADQDVSFGAMQQKMNQLAKIVQDDPAVDTVTAFTGGTMNTVNQAHIFAQLKPVDERKLDIDHVIARIRRATAGIPGATLYLQAAQDVTTGGRSSSAQFQYTLQSQDLQALNHWAPILLKRISALPLLRDQNSDQQTNGLEASLLVDRDTAGRLGVSMSAIDNTLNDAFGQREVSTIYEGMNQYYVIEVVAPQYMRDPAGLHQIYAASGGGTLVPLSSFARYGPDAVALAVNHQGVLPSVTLSFNLTPGASLGDAVRAISDAESAVGLPPSIQGSFQGTAQAFQSSLATEPWLIACALAAVYIVLGMLYESYIHPITILSTLPSAAVGALLAIVWFKSDLNFIALIGILLLIGIVKKNAILMIDFALTCERSGGKSPLDAIHEACLLRFRPIMMTTLAAMFGALPLALGGGDGAELRRPLGITIVGGLILSQMLTLFTTPVVYLYMDRLQTLGRRLGRLGRSAVPEPAGASD